MVLSTTCPHRHICLALFSLRASCHSLRNGEKKSETLHWIQIHRFAQLQSCKSKPFEMNTYSIHGPDAVYISFILLAIGIGYVQVNEWVSVVGILKQHQHQQTLPSIHSFTHYILLTNACLNTWPTRSSTHRYLLILLFHRRFATHMCPEIHISKWNGSRVEHTPHITFAYCFRRKNASEQTSETLCVERFKSIAKQKEWERTQSCAVCWPNACAWMHAYVYVYVCVRVCEWNNGWSHNVDTAFKYIDTRLRYTRLVRSTVFC